MKTYVVIEELRDRPRILEDRMNELEGYRFRNSMVAGDRIIVIMELGHVQRLPTLDRVASIKNA